MLMKKLLLLLLLFPVEHIFSQADSMQLLIAFYNVENLFDPEDDSLTNDDDFTPEGFNHWSYYKYIKKVNNIAKVFLAMDQDSPPAIIGMAEIENSNVLKQFCYRSPLKKYGYRYVHYDSPDVRGVDVALLYLPDRITIKHSEPVRIVFPFEPHTKNRDILYAVLQFSNGDSLHLFINHWTSRYGGYAPTVRKRNYYAEVLRHKTDSILSQSPNANILIMGDFNDYPTDESLSVILSARNPDDHSPDSKLYNLMLPIQEKNNMGSHKHEDFWGCLDQIIVSKPLLTDSNSTKITDGKAAVFVADFMIEPDEKYGGYKTLRTFSGPKYIGGYADHLPVFVRILLSGRQ
jgi:hypothetical protein